ncbi:MAG: DUF4255 domain-containing protein [Lachnospiraceae bacterium]|nr:DUF4255 domain-containing protein [Lachnospiraceae bacterium]
MESRYIITDMGKLLVNLAADMLMEELDVPEGQIGLGIPGESEQLSLYIYMYDIRENVQAHTGHFKAVGCERLKYPSRFYDLYYMLVPSAKGDPKYKMEEEFRFMDVLLRRFGDMEYLDEEMRTAVTLYSPDLEEKVKIWNALNQSLKPAIYCKAGPMEVLSDKTKDVKRVTNVQMRYEEK